MVLRPICASAVARFTATEVLPVPPLPPVTAMTCTGAASSVALDSARGMDTRSVTACQQFIVGAALRLAREFDGSCDQLMRTRGPQVIGNCRPIAHIGHWQLCTGERGEHTAEAHRLIQARERTTLRDTVAEMHGRLIDHAALCARWQHQHELQRGAALAQRAILSGRFAVATGHPRP